MSSTSPSRRVERKERLRGEILAAASKMFADRGYEAVTLREIAKEIGYTHAVIYQHFPDKWHILAELSSETIGLMELMSTTMEPLRAPSRIPPAPRTAAGA